MRTEVSTRTIAEVEDNTGDFIITCFADMNEDGSTTPTIYKSRVINTPMTIDNTSGKEGELLLSYEGNSVGEIDEDGNLIIAPDGDDANKYNKEQNDLTYDGEG